MSKFFIKSNQINGNNIEILGQDSYHISNVLRCKIGEKITISEENGLDYLCEIHKFEQGKVILNILDCMGIETEPNLKITLYQALPKAEKMEFIIQKCVEIGVDTIIPIKTERCIVKLNGKEDKKIERWQKISEAAAKQSQRGKIPKIKAPLSFKQAIEDSKKLNKVIIPYEKEEGNSLKSFTKRHKCDNIGIFIGPEGGFTESEIKLATCNNIIPITLGKRILRTETAALFTAIILLYEMEGS